MPALVHVDLMLVRPCLRIYRREAKLTQTRNELNDGMRGTCDMGKEADLEQSSKILERAKGPTQYHISGIGVRN